MGLPVTLTFERWEIRAVSVTGSESWRIEADGLLDAVCLLAESLGLDLDG